ncbi:hypothetical protein Bpfe_013235, partial [Biomphalaria pfeifferi]
MYADICEAVNTTPSFRNSSSSDLLSRGFFAAYLAHNIQSLRMTGTWLMASAKTTHNKSKQALRHFKKKSKFIVLLVVEQSRITACNLSMCFKLYSEESEVRALPPPPLPLLPKVWA